MKTQNLPVSILTKSQSKIYGWKEFTMRKTLYRIQAHVSYDDECGNGHNSFSITGQIDEKYRGEWKDYSGGCIHEEIAKHFPELAPFIKWHLVSSDGPMHYVANTVYHASDRDHRGLLKGERRQLRNGKSGQLVWERVMRDDRGEIVQTIGNDWVDSDEKPAGKLTANWEPVWLIGEGKARELNHARSSAVWPEATDEQLCLEPGFLKKALEERLPALMAEFKSDMEKLGFTY